MKTALRDIQKYENYKTTIKKNYQETVVGNRMKEQLLREWIREKLVEAGASAERQEYGLIDSINAMATPEKPVELKSSGETILDVIGASKVEGMNDLGKEPYSDVQIHLADGTILNVSAKGSSAPTLAGGGLVALTSMLPNLVTEFLQRAVDELVAQGYKKGDTGVPDVYGQITGEDALLVLQGNEAMGGPIDYMYQGPMDVTAQHCDIRGECSITVSGAFTNIEDYADDHVLYLRARKRRNDQPFDPAAVDKAGLPSIFGKSPTKGARNRRIVITDKVPSGALIVSI